MIVGNQRLPRFTCDGVFDLLKWACWLVMIAFAILRIMIIL